LKAMSGFAVLVASWDIDDVQLAACGLLRDEFLSWVVRDVVAVDNVVVPVARAELQSIGALKAEGAFPGAWLGGGILDDRQGKLGLVVVP